MSTGNALNMNGDMAKAEGMELLARLPAIYQDRDDPETPLPLEGFLGAFERVLLNGEPEPAPRKRGSKRERNPLAVEGLGRKIARLHTLFDAAETPEEFLGWLGNWVALSIHTNLSAAKQRKLIANLIPLYRIRGTRAYMEKLLAICVDAGTSVSEQEFPAMQVGVHATVGRDMWLGGGPPYFFRVTMVATDMGAVEVQAQREIAYEVIELAKPAHTVYDFVVESPQLQVGVHSTVGVDTVLGVAAAQLP